CHSISAIFSTCSRSSFVLISSSTTVIFTLSLHDALPIYPGEHLAERLDRLGARLERPLQLAGLLALVDDLLQVLEHAGERLADLIHCGRGGRTELGERLRQRLGAGRQRLDQVVDAAEHLLDLAHALG